MLLCCGAWGKATKTCTLKKHYGLISELTLYDLHYHDNDYAWNLFWDIILVVNIVPIFLCIIYKLEISQIWEEGQEELLKCGTSMRDSLLLPFVKLTITTDLTSSSNLSIFRLFSLILALFENFVSPAVPQNSLARRQWKTLGLGWISFRILPLQVFNEDI